jgi:hypothetical protein
MRSLSLIVVVGLALLGADVAVAAPSQAPPNQNGGSGQVPGAPVAPNQNGGSGQVPAAPPVRTGTATPAPRPAPAPASAPAAPARSTPKRRAPQGLPTTVRRLRGCLNDVTRREGRVLVLRSGLGRHGPTSRVRVARALDLSSPGVARAERRGVRRLRAFARARGCTGQKDDAKAVVRDAAAALGAGQSGGDNRPRDRTSSSGGAPSSEPAPPAEPRSAPAVSVPATIAGRDGMTNVLLALVIGLLGLTLIGRGLLKQLRE